MTKIQELPIRDVGQAARDIQARIAHSPIGSSSDGGGGQRGHDAQGSVAASPSETIAAIRAAHRERVFWMEQRKRSDLALGSYLRSALGWSLDKSPAERERIRAEAAAIMAAGEKHVKAWRKIQKQATKGKVPLALPDTTPELRPWAHVVVPQIEMRGKTDELEAAATKAMRRLAAQLPVAAWAEGISGFGMLGLAIIVGEAGDLSLYANPGKLWKRMGVAVVGDKRQGGLSSIAPKAEWIEHGYNRRRRSRLYTIGAAIVRTNGPYREVYLNRKAYEAARAEADGLIVAPSAKIPKGKHEQYRSLGHIDNRARRYAEKRLLRDLWKAWRAVASHQMSQDQGMIAASPGDVS